jgi:hypothetical protein
VQAGEARLDARRQETWLTKPKAMQYAELYERLGPLTERGGSLWRRQMVLGPAPEFCLVTPGPIEAPEELTPMRVSCTSI